MEFSIGDKIIFKNDDLKGFVIKIKSSNRVTVLSQDGFEMDVSTKEIIKIPYGTDKVDSYGDFFTSKESDSIVPKKKKNSKITNSINVDLHIEKLYPNYHFLNNYEIMQIQLNECSLKIEQFLQSNVQKIEIIHGVGEGVLKKEVHLILKSYNLRFLIFIF